MKKIFFVCAFVSMTIVVNAGIIKNANFNEDRKYWTPWKVGNSVERKISVFGRNKSRCAFIEVKGKGKGAWTQVIGELVPGDYIISVWIRSKDMKGNAELQVYAKKANKMLYFKHVKSQGQTDWKQLCLNFKVPVGSKKWIITLFQNNAGKVWFDDVEIKKSKNSSDEIDIAGLWKFTPGDNQKWKDLNFDDSSWKTIKVPSLWEKQGYGNLEGYAWYRKKLILPDSFKQKTLLLTLGAVSKVDELFFNGVKVGSTGKFPPHLVAETFKMRKYLIPGKILKSGVNLIAVRVNDGEIKMSGGIWKAPCLLKLASPEEYIKVSLKSQYPGNIFPLNENIKLNFMIKNYGRADINNALVKIQVSDYNFNKIAGIEFKFSVKAGAENQKHYSTKLKDEAIYYVNMTIKTNSIEVKKQFYIGILSDKNLTALMKKSKFGVAAHLNRLENHDLKKTLNISSRAGLKWIRTGFLWKSLEPREGKFCWQRFDRTFSQAANKNINLLPTLAIIPEWASSDPLGRLGVRYKSGRMPVLKYWEKYVYEMVKRYSKYTSHWEIWNEPNLKSYWKPMPESYEYYKLLKAAYEQVKIANPDSQVLTAGFAPYFFIKNKNLSGTIFLDELYQYSGDNPLFDKIAYHPYTPMRKNISNAYLENSLKNLFSRIKQVMTKNKDTKTKWWFTETGCPDLPRTIDERRQAECLVVILTLCAAEDKVENVCWYNFREDGSNPDFNEHNFGLLKQDYSPKPAFYAYRKLIANLNESNCISQIKTPDGISIYKFVGKNNIWVVWSDKKNILTLPAGKCKVTDLMGKVIPSSSCRTDVSQSPIYIEFNKR